MPPTLKASGATAHPPWWRPSLWLKECEILCMFFHSWKNEWANIKKIHTHNNKQLDNVKRDVIRNGHWQLRILLLEIVYELYFHKICNMHVKVHINYVPIILSLLKVHLNIISFSISFHRNVFLIFYFKDCTIKVFINLDRLININIYIY